jgi:hypothetical protein
MSFTPWVSHHFFHTSLILLSWTYKWYATRPVCTLMPWRMQLRAQAVFLRNCRVLSNKCTWGHMIHHFFSTDKNVKKMSEHIIMPFSTELFTLKSKPSSGHKLWSQRSSWNQSGVNLGRLTTLSVPQFPKMLLSQGTESSLSKFSGSHPWSATGEQCDREHISASLSISLSTNKSSMIITNLTLLSVRTNWDRTW